MLTFLDVEAPMHPFLMYVLLLVAMAGVAQLLAVVSSCLATGDMPPLLEKVIARLHPPAVSEPMPGVLYELELARLAAELTAVHLSDPQGRALRVTACTIAYDDALLACCRSHGLDCPSGPTPLTPTQRLDAEAHLLAAGASW